MKQESVQGINQIGKIGLFLTVIASLVCYMFMIGCIGAAIIIHNAPATLADITVNADTTINMNLADANLESTAVKTLQGYLEAGEGASISLGSLNLYLTNYESTDNGGTGVFGGQIAEFTFNELWVIPLFLCIGLAAAVVMLLFNGFFANSLKKCKSPFEEKVIKDGTNFAFVLVAWSVVTAAVMALVEGFFTGNVKIGGTGMVIIVLSLVIFFIMRIFRYAADIVNS